MGDREKLHQAQEIQRELNDKGLSRRAFLDRLKVLGVGFGAAAMLGVRDADAGVQSDASVSLESTNPTLNNIIKEGRQDLVGEDGPNILVAEEGRYSRGYSRGYSRTYNKYARYSKYSRTYTRYAKYSRYARYSRYSRTYTRYAKYARYAKYSRTYTRYARYSRYSRY
jgi:hypothetical protein